MLSRSQDWNRRYLWRAWCRKTSLANIIPTLFEVLDDDMSVRDEATTGTDPRLVVMTTSGIQLILFKTIWCRALDELTGTTDNTGFALFKKFSGKRKLFRDVNGISDTHQSMKLDML